MENLLNKKGFICDMDGVIYHGNRLLPGVPEFLNWLNENKKNFLFLTNSSQYTPKELQQKLKRISVFYQYCFSLSSLRLFLWPPYFVQNVLSTLREKRSEECKIS